MSMSPVALARHQEQERLSRASASPPVASPVKEEDRFAPGAFWEASDLNYAHAVVIDASNRQRTKSWGICWGPGVQSSETLCNGIDLTRDNRTYRGNIATTVADFLIALTRACGVTVGGVRYVSNPALRDGQMYAFRSGDWSAGDTLPSPAPSGSYTVAGSTYDHIPSRFDEPDEDAVFKKQQARYAKLREDETAALGRFERIRDASIAHVKQVAPAASVCVDKVEKNDALVSIRIGTACVECVVENWFGVAERSSKVDWALDRLDRILGALAMRGDR